MTPEDARRKLLASGWSHDPRSAILRDPAGRAISEPSPAEWIQLALGTSALDLLAARKAEAEIYETTISAARRTIEDILDALGHRHGLDVSDRKWSRNGNFLSLTVGNRAPFPDFNERTIKGLAQSDSATVNSVTEGIAMYLSLGGT